MGSGGGKGGTGGWGEASRKEEETTRRGEKEKQQRDGRSTHRKGERKATVSYLSHETRPCGLAAMEPGAAHMKHGDNLGYG